MEQVLLQEVIKLNKARKRRNCWKQFVRVMAAVVVFCTTYALILPAITMERDPICGMEEHFHEDGCYQDVAAVICPMDEQAGHIHSDFCYAVSKVPVCMLEEQLPHTHADSCYGEAQLICAEEKTEGHTHVDACYQIEISIGCGMEECDPHTHIEECYETVTTSVCTLEESEEHTHTEACSVEVQHLICELQETEGHTHSEDCDIESKSLICNQPEVISHTHGEGCYEKPLICNLEQTEGHAHTDACFRTLICTQEEIAPHHHDETCQKEASRKLICQLAEHIHAESCYRVEQTAPTEPGFFCGYGKHIHGEGCYDGEGVLTCSIPEHTHTAECIVENYDAAADVETAQIWEATLKDISLTENWHTDLLAIANSQLGYTESQRNVVLNENGALLGYTRYGEWYGIPHGDWCAMFASFCMHYAGIEDIPLQAGCISWIDLLAEKNFYRTADVYQPNPGDLIFFDWNGEDGSDHVGIVSEVIPPKEEEPGRIVTIEGNADDCVSVCTYAMDDPTIIGYGLIPSGKQRTLFAQGEDYTVDVNFDSTAMIPADAQLSVREIAQDTQEYQTYYEQALLAIQNPEQPDAEQGISFARFFDISFLANGQVIEPAAPVEITIHYDEAIAIPEDNTSVAVHFAQDGVEVLEAQASQQTEELPSEEAADTFVFTQASFSVTGTVVTNANSRAAGIDLSGAVAMIDHDTTIKIYDASNVQTSKLADGDAFKIVLEDTVYSYQFSNGKPVTLYLTLNKTLQLSEFICSDAVSNALIDGGGNTFVMQIPAPSNGQNVTYRVELTGNAVNQTGGVANVSLRWDVSIFIYGKRQQFVCADDQGNQFVLDLMGGSYTSASYDLVVEKLDAASYADAIRQYAANQFKREALGDNVVYDVYLRSKTNPGQRVSIPAPYSLKVIYAQSPVTLSSTGMAAVINFSNGYADAMESAKADYVADGVNSLTITGNNQSLSRFAVASLKGISAGTTGAGFKLSYNEQTDAFLRDPAYAAFYNPNSPIGTAGSFHIVAFDTANLGTHTNGNILAKNLYAGSNFGTNGYPYELTYVQNYLQVNANSASEAAHVLVIGSNNELGLYDNGNKYTINGQSIDRPKNIVQDVDTSENPFIDLDRVRAEIRQIASDLVTYDDANLSVTIMDQKNVITLTDPAAVGILNVTPADDRVFGKDYIQLAGFRSGENGSIVINVDCTGYTQINLPKALVVLDGKEQSTNEVVEFSAGKVLWNFINAEGVTINTHLMTGMVIAPGATVNINQNLNGTVVADNVNVKAESHRTDFTGRIVPSKKTEDHSVTVRKIKSGYVGTTLSGAHFDLYVWSGSSWRKVNAEPIITDSGGLCQLSDLTPNVAYQLVETQAPAGYLLMEDPYYFWIRESGTATMPTLRPQNFSGTVVGPGDIVYISNEPDVQIQTTQIELEKKWVTSQTLTIRRVNVDLIRIAWLEGVEVSRELYKTLTLTSVLDWKYTVTDLPLSGTDANGNELTYTYTVAEVPVTGFRPTYAGTNAGGVTGGKITITNSQTGDGYVLPETGGGGKHIHTFCGVTLIAFTLMYILIPKQKRRREAG